MKNILRKMFVLSLFFLLFQFNTSNALTVDPLSFPEKVSKAQLIFQGTVIKRAIKISTPVHPGHKGSPHTFYTFDIEKIFKGSIEGGGDTITLRFEGAKIPEEPDGRLKPLRIVKRNIITGKDTEIISFKSGEIPLKPTDTEKRTKILQALKTARAEKNTRLVWGFDEGELPVEGEGGISLVDIPGTPSFNVGEHLILFVTDNGNVISPIVGWNQGAYLLNLPEDKEAWLTRDNTRVIKPQSQTELKREELRQWLAGPRDMNKPEDYTQTLEQFGTTNPDDINIAEPQWQPPQGARPYDPEEYAGIIGRQIETELAKQQAGKAIQEPKPVKNLDSRQKFYTDAEGFALDPAGKRLESRSE